MDSQEEGLEERRYLHISHLLNICWAVRVVSRNCSVSNPTQNAPQLQTEQDPHDCMSNKEKGTPIQNVFLERSQEIWTTAAQDTNLSTPSITA